MSRKGRSRTRRYDAAVSLEAPHGCDDWFGVSAGALPVAAVTAWLVRPDCGGIAIFLGTVRDHAEGRPGVTRLHYEAYEEEVIPRLASVAASARESWPALGRLALLHRIGTLEVGEVSVVVAASAPHRPEAFAASRFAIDTLKATVPIWKRETWSGGEAWSECSHPVGEIAAAGGGP